MELIIYFILVILPLLCLIPIIYLYYNFRYPEVTDLDDFLFNNPPLLLNALSGSILSKKVGIPDLDGVIVTIIDLIRKGYLKPYYKQKEDSEYLITLKISSINKKNIEQFELDIIHFLKRFSKNNCINLQKVKENIVKDKNPKIFKKTFLNMKKHIFKRYLNNNRLFIIKSNKIIYLFGYMGLLIGFIIFSVSFTGLSKFSAYLTCFSIFLIFLSFIFLIVIPNIHIEWTDFGAKYFLESQKFKKSINDYSLIEIDSLLLSEIELYLTYSIGAGISNNFFKLLKSSENLDLEKAEVFNFYKKGGYSLLKSIFKDSRYYAENDSLDFLRRTLKAAGMN